MVSASETPGLASGQTIARSRKAKAKRDSEGDVAVASAWLVLYLLMLVATLTEPFLARAVEFAALY